LITDHLENGRLVSAEEAVEAVALLASEGDVVLTVGAGDVTAYGPEIVAALDG
jgi:UDP-N-acetylmuramate--alanine ligase